MTTSIGSRINSTINVSSLILYHIMNMFSPFTSYRKMNSAQGMQTHLTLIILSSIGFSAVLRKRKKSRDYKMISMKSLEWVLNQCRGFNKTRWMSSNKCLQTYRSLMCSKICTITTTVENKPSTLISSALNSISNISSKPNLLTLIPSRKTRSRTYLTLLIKPGLKLSTHKLTCMRILNMIIQILSLRKSIRRLCTNR